MFIETVLKYLLLACEGYLVFNLSCMLIWLFTKKSVIETYALITLEEWEYLMNSRFKRSLVTIGVAVILILIKIYAGNM